MKEKHRAWRRYIETRDDNKYKEFRRLTNKVRKMTRNLQRDMEKDISKSAKTNPEKFWSFIKSKLKTKVGVSDLVKIQDNDGETLTKNDGEKAEVLLEFFSSVFTREPDTNVPTLEPKSFNETLDAIMVTKQQVKNKLDKVKIDKSQGPDDVHPRTQGRLPNIWKKAQFTAIFKKGSRKEACNYRPVSLTSIACKILESIIRERIMNHLKTNEAQ